MMLYGPYHWRDLKRGWIDTHSGIIKWIQASFEGGGVWDDHIKASYDTLDFYKHYQRHTRLNLNTYGIIFTPHTTWYLKIGEELGKFFFFDTGFR